MLNTFEALPATKEDIPLILKFIKQLAEYENLSHQLRANEESLQESLFGAKAYAEVIIGYLNKSPVSYALFTHNFSTLLGRQGLYLVDLFVIPEARKQGIGRAMLTYLSSIAKERKCGRIDWVVLNWNKSAISFYEKIGAKSMDEWKMYRITEEDFENLTC